MVGIHAKQVSTKAWRYIYDIISKPFTRMVSRMSIMYSDEVKYAHEAHVYRNNA